MTILLWDTMYQTSYCVCLLLILSNNVVSEYYSSVSFIKLLDVHGNDPKSSPVNILHNQTFPGCAKHVAFNASLLWFLYNKEKKECVSSQCWDVHFQEPLNNQHNLYRKRASVPRSCSDVKSMSPDADDGEYWIYPDTPTFLGCPTKIYCHNINTDSPTEYISLSMNNTGVYPDKSNKFCTGEGPLIGDGIGKDGTTHFNKIRVNINNMTVVDDDLSFTIGNGMKREYGHALDCYTVSWRGCGPVGTFDIDTRQTGLIVSLQQTWTTFGYDPFEPSVTRSVDGRKIHLLCGGCCGGCKPEGNSLQLHMNFEEDLPFASARLVTQK